jgi:uncharacterized protein (TIGR02118 family)
MRAALLTEYRHDFAIDTVQVAAPDGAPPFLGVATLAFANEEAFGAAAASPEFAAAVADLGNLADAERLPTAYVGEVVIVG